MQITLIQSPGKMCNALSDEASDSMIFRLSGVWGTDGTNFTDVQ
jgi:hypothetical protein